MISRICCILALLFFYQQESIVEIKTEVEILNEQIERKIKKDLKNYNKDSLEILSIPWLSLASNLSLRDFTNKSFLNYLNVSYDRIGRRYSKKKYLSSESLIVNQEGKHVAFTHHFKIYKNYYSSGSKEFYQGFIDYIISNSIDFVFYIQSTPVGTYFCLKNDEIWVYSRKYDNNKVVYTFNEFTSEHWSKFSENLSF